MRDLHSNIKVRKSITAKNVTGSTDFVSSYIDSQGYESLEYIIAVGVTGDTLSASLKFDFYLEHADADSTGAAPETFSTVTDSEQVIGVPLETSGLFATVDSTANDDLAFAIGYIGGKRFTRIKVDLTGTHTNGTPMSAVAVLGTPSIAPTV